MTCCHLRNQGFGLTTDRTVIKAAPAKKSLTQTRGLMTAPTLRDILFKLLILRRLQHSTTVAVGFIPILPAAG